MLYVSAPLLASSIRVVKSNTAPVSAFPVAPFFFVILNAPSPTFAVISTVSVFTYSIE